jgi:hypothetical protein
LEALFCWFSPRFWICEIIAPLFKRSYNFYHLVSEHPLGFLFVLFFFPHHARFSSFVIYIEGASW